MHPPSSLMAMFTVPDLSYNRLQPLRNAFPRFQLGVTFNAPAFNVHGQRRNPHIICQAVAAKLEDGNVRAAVRILISAESPAVPSDASLSKLREKHPPASGKAGNLPVPQQDKLTVCWSMSQRSVGQFSRFQPALLGALIFCAHSIYAT